MSLNIPELMPVLSRGGHSSPAEGACIMEYASFLNGEAWTDAPSCTHPLLATVARLVNDALDDSERQRLLPLLPRLMGTTDPGHWQEIREAGVGYVAHLIGNETPGVTETAEYSALPHISAEAAVWEALIAVQLSGGDPVDYLSTLIDAYDKATGRTAPATVTEDDLRRCAELTGAKA